MGVSRAHTKDTYDGETRKQYLKNYEGIFGRKGKKEEPKERNPYKSSSMDYFIDKEEDNN
jgi:hypothetical protein